MSDTPAYGNEKPAHQVINELIARNAELRGLVRDMTEAMKNKNIRIAELEEAGRVLAEEVVAWRDWEQACSAIAVQNLNKQVSVELNETADRLWMNAGGTLSNRTNANPAASAMVKKAQEQRP